MSADGYGILGLAAIAIVATPVLIGGAVVAGSIYAAGKLVNYIGEEQRRSNELREKKAAEQRARLAAEEAEDKKKIQEIMGSYSRLQNNYVEARRELNKKMTESYSAFAEEIKGSQERTHRGVNILVANADENRRKLVNSWFEKSSIQADSFSKSVHSVLSDMKEKVQAETIRFSEVQNRVAEDSRLHEYAATQLEAAQMIIKTIRVEFGTVQDSVIDGYNKAAEYYNEGMYETAYGVASSVTLEGYDVLEKGIVERERKTAFAEILRMQIVDMSSRIDAIKKFEFDYNNERYEEDLVRFNPFFEGIISQLSKASRNLEDVENLDEYALSRLQRQLTEIDGDIGNCIKTAVQRMVFAYAENDTASNITDLMDEQGYDVDGYAYESGQEGKPVHINFKGRVSGDSITVILTPEEVDGVRRMRVSVHDFGVDGEADTRRQDEIRTMLEKALDISISCSNRGHVSSNVMAADLHAVEKMDLQ